MFIIKYLFLSVEKYASFVPTKLAAFASGIPHFVFWPRPLMFTMSFALKKRGRAFDTSTPETEKLAFPFLPGA
jgi:hypothetical protein